MVHSIKGDKNYYFRWLQASGFRLSEGAFYSSIGTTWNIIYSIGRPLLNCISLEGIFPLASG